MKTSDGGGTSGDEAARRLRREMRREIIDKQVRNFLYPTVALTIFLCLVVKQGEVGLDPPPGPITAPVVGVLLLFSSVLVCIVHLISYLSTIFWYYVSIFVSSRLAKQTDRILDLDRDQRRNLIEFFWGGGKAWFPRKFALNQEVKDWCKQSGVRYLTIARPGPDTEVKELGSLEPALVWFRRPQDAVAFKMRWY